MAYSEDGVSIKEGKELYYGGLADIQAGRTSSGKKKLKRAEEIFQTCLEDEAKDYIAQIKPLL